MQKVEQQEEALERGLAVEEPPKMDQALGQTAAHRKARSTPPDEILVVDDTPASLKLIQEILSNTGYRVRLATDGDLALRSAKAQPPSLVLLDIRMPGMDGFEVCRRLKADEKTRSIPVIFLSILEDEGEKVKAFQLGAVDFINKPIRAAEVLARVSTHIALRHAQSDLELRNQELEAARAGLEQRVKDQMILRREIHHRVKNNLQVIISLLYLQSSRASDPNTQALLKDSQARVRSIALVHEMLYQRKDLSKISFADYVRQLAADLFIAYRVSQEVVALRVFPEGGIFLGISVAISCGLIINELITNALKYAFPNGAAGEIEVSLESEADAGRMVLTVCDNGIGLPKDFDVSHCSTMGLSLVADLARQLEGRLEFESGPNGRGTRVRIAFPQRL